MQRTAWTTINPNKINRFTLEFASTLCDCTWALFLRYWHGYQDGRSGHSRPVVLY